MSSTSHQAGAPKENVSVGTEDSHNGTIPGTEDGVQQRKFNFVDIGINLTDDQYSGLYHGTQRHPSDVYEVVERAKSVECRKLIVTGSDVESSRRAIGLSKVFPDTVYATLGIHPCSSAPFADPTKGSEIIQQLRTLALESEAEITSYGELGLDYDRLEHCSKEIQLQSFNAQLDLFVSLPATLQKPLFLHSRAAHEDFVAVLKERLEKGELGKRGVVHSFTGTRAEMEELVSLGFDIGVNGCSLKTEENCEVVKHIPLERLQIETDGPWCEMRPTHAGTKYAKDAGFVEKAGVEASREQGKKGKEGEVMGAGGWKWAKKEKWTVGALVKGRNESCLIERVAWAVAEIKGVEVSEVVDAAWGNSGRMFGLGIELKNGRKGGDGV